MEKLAPEHELIERILWLIKLRWIAVAGVSAAVLFANQILGFSLPALPLYAITLILAAYNLIFLFAGRLIARKNPASLVRIASGIANLQISLDLACLAGLIHYSGGIENPFIFYFIFHMIIAGILLSRRASYLQATFTVALFLVVVGLEYFQVIGHYCLKGFILQDLHANKVYILGVSFVFISTLYLAVYMAVSVSDKLRQRERSLKEANLLLEEKDRIKSEYVLRVSHDIKEHLAAVQSCLEPVAEQITGTLNLRQKDLIQRAEHRTEKLMFFVRKLLEITRIKLSRQIEMADFSLKETLQDALAMVAARAKDKGIDIESDIKVGSDTLWGAQVYIEETLANILANAVKYTPAGGRVVLSAREQDDSILIRISDTGIGIPEDDLPRVFEEFFRAKNARELDHDGTGLGLAIAKQVLDRHNGKIWVDSELGKGSTFNIILPKMRR